MTYLRYSVCCLLLLLVCANAPADECHRGFDVADPIVTASSVYSAVYGDFNEDGLVDVAYNNDRGLIVGLNRGNAVFESQPPILDGGAGYGHLTAVADVNGDHHLDLIYFALSGAGLAVSFGDGHGAFAHAIETNVEYTTHRWLFDVNHDGTPDCIEALDANRFRVAFGARDGKFTEGPIIEINPGTGSDGQSIAGDFDGDGFVDVAHVYLHGIAYAWGTADPNKFVLNSLAIDNVDFSTPLGLIDLEGDGAAEIVCGHPDTLHVIRSAKRVTTTSILSVPGMTSFASLLFRDVNGDGRADIVASFGTATFGIYSAIPGGGFAPAVFVSLPGATGVAGVDVYGDGSQGIAATSGLKGLRMIPGAALAAGSGAAHPVAALGLGRIQQVYDVDGDGSDDIVISDTYDPTIQVLFGDGAGHFHAVSPPKRYPDARLINIQALVGDFDRDGRADLARSAGSSNYMKPAIEFDNDRGVFGPSSVTVDVDAFVGLLHVERGVPPVLLARRGSELGIVTISPARSAQFTVITPITAAARVSIKDMDGDGIDELILYSKDNGTLHVLKGPAVPWQEVATSSLSTGSGPSSLAPADLNGDGRMDFVLSYGTNVYVVALAQQDGTYSTKLYSDLGDGAGIVVVDFDGDGVPDLVTLSYGNIGDPELLQVLRGSGDGKFEPYATALIEQPFGGQILKDVDGDGLVDVIIGAYFGVQTVRNICATPRMRGTAYPHTVNTGQRATVFMQAIPVDGFGIGGITIREEGKVLSTGKPVFASDGLTTSWMTPPLTAGTHIYDIEFLDFLGRPSHATVEVIAVNPSRRRPARH